MRLSSPTAVGSLGVEAVEVSGACGPMELAARLAGHPPTMVIDGVQAGGERCTIVASGAAVRFTGRGTEARATYADGASCPLPVDRDPLGRLGWLLDELEIRGGDGLPAPLTSLYGLIGYDAVRCLERLPSARPPAPGQPDYALFLPQRAVLFPGDGGSPVAAAIAPTAGEARVGLAALTRTMRRADASAPPPAIESSRAQVQASFSPAGYEAAVRRAKEHILDGDVYQLVLSLRLSVPYAGRPLDLAARLRGISRARCQFAYQDDTVAVVGASPEPLVVMADGRCTIRVLAGTRSRGRTAAEDAALTAELAGSEKERAEHRMLVDLARNDLGRVCRAGSVAVDELMTIRSYSHVMHLETAVVGTLRPEVGADQLIRAVFPAGTMTGAPKIRSMELIDELEPQARGLYSGAVGMVRRDEVQLYLTIRSVVLTGGAALLQAGAGIVHDSEPAAEYRECLDKLEAARAALGLEGCAA